MTERALDFDDSLRSKHGDELPQGPDSDQLNVIQIRRTWFWYSITQTKPYLLGNASNARRHFGREHFRKVIVCGRAAEQQQRPNAHWFRQARPSDFVLLHL